MNNNERTNPFRSRSRNNFPSLDDFFEQPSIGQMATGDDSSFALSPEQSFCSRSTSMSCHDLSMDMSIGGRAAMTEHRRYVQKYGIDGATSANNLSSNSENSEKFSPSPLSAEEDWDRIMDDSCSNVSFSSSAILNSRKMQLDRNTLNDNRKVHSPDESYADDASTSFFDKSIVRVLMTPEKNKAKLGEENEPNIGVTLHRGNANDSTSMADYSVDQSVNVSSIGSGVEGMFHAALRFHDDLGLQSSIAKEDESTSGDRSSGKDKSSSVSFAADTSFATQDSGRLTSKRNQQGRILEHGYGEGLEGFEFAPESPIRKRNKDDCSVFGDSSFLGSPISPTISRVAVATTPSSPIFSAGSSPNLSPRRRHSTPVRNKSQTEMHHQSSISFLGLSPIDSESGVSLEREAKDPLLLPFDERIKESTISGTSFDSSSVECTITHKSIEMVWKKSAEKKCHRTVMTSDSFSECTPSKSLSEEEVLTAPIRKFGTNSEFRLNSSRSISSGQESVSKIFAETRNKPLNSRENIEGYRIRDTQTADKHRRGVILARASKLKALGIERANSLPIHFPSDHSKRHEDF